MYGDGALTALAYAMNTEFGRVLANEMVSILRFFLSLLFHILITVIKYICFILLTETL